MKCFINHVQNIEYNPKDENGVKMKNVKKRAIILQVLTQSFGGYGYQCEDIFVSEDDPKYEFLLENISDKLKDFPNWTLDIERDSRGFIRSIVPIQKYESIADVAKFFAPPPALK